MGLENSFDQLLEDNFLLTDGAKGTNLFLKGLVTGDAPELWNLIQPKKFRTSYRFSGGRIAVNSYKFFCWLKL